MDDIIEQIMADRRRVLRMGFDAGQLVLVVSFDVLDRLRYAAGNYIVEWNGATDGQPVWKFGGCPVLLSPDVKDWQWLCTPMPRGVLLLDLSHDD